MSKHGRRIEEPGAADTALTAPSPACSPPPAISLLELPDSVLDDIASWAVQPGASRALSLTCRAFNQANLRHAPAFRIQLDRQRCDQLLTPRVIAALPLHSLTQPLVLGELCCSVDLVTTPEAAAAVHSLAGAWKQPPVVRCVQLDMFGRLEEEAKAGVEAAPEEADITPLVRIILQQQSSRWEQLVALLCTLDLRCVDKVVVSNFLRFSAADVQVLAPFCQACTCLQFLCSTIWPSLEFWHHLVQSMPSVTHVLFMPLQESASVAMHEAVQLMAEQPWARWLDITISYKHPEEVTYWQAQDWSSMGKCKVHVTLMA